MATYCIQIRSDDDKSVWFDSNDVTGGVVAEVINLASGQIAAGTTMTKTYNDPEWVGRSIKVISAIGGTKDTLNFTTNTTNGYPQLVISPAGFVRKLIVLIL